jgi:cyclic beta-1,2-glucan synthetase
MDALPRHRGHFLNWVDTLTLRPLEPRYVSTVDSGNLAAMLLLLAQCCHEALLEPLALPHAMAGIGDEVTLLRSSLAQADERRGAAGVGFEELHEALRRIESLIESPSRALEPDQLFEQLEVAASDVHDIVKTLASEGNAGELREALLWAEAMHSNIRGQRRDQLELSPWLRKTDRVLPQERAAEPETDSGDQGSDGNDPSRQSFEEISDRLHTLSRRALQMFDEMGASVPDIIQLNVAARKIFDLAGIWQQIEELSTTIPADFQMDLMLKVLKR